MAPTKKSLIGTRRSTVAGTKKTKSSNSRAGSTKPSVVTKSKAGAKEFFVEAAHKFLNKDGKNFLVTRKKRGGTGQFYNTKTSNYVTEFGHLDDSTKEAAARLPPTESDTAAQQAKRDADVDSMKWNRLRKVSNYELEMMTIY